MLAGKRGLDNLIGIVDVNNQQADGPSTKVLNFEPLGPKFEAFGWHYYTYDLPERAEELGRSARCNQAFRLGETAWGVQFHPEVTMEIVRSWLADDDFPHDLDRAVFAAETERRIGEWNDFGRTLCGAFLELAGRASESRPELAKVRS